MKGFFRKLGYIWAALTESKRRKHPQPPVTPAPAPISPPPPPDVVRVKIPEKQPPAQEKLTETRHLRRYERTLVVGVDFGTSSTKVVWQDLSENYFELFRWQERKGLESVLFPSTVCVRAGTLIFGRSGPLDGDVWLPSIKLCVLCSTNPSVCRCDGSVAKYGQIQLPRMICPLSAAAVGSLFLAYVFQQVEQHLKETFPNDEVFLIWNVGCPMDHLDATDSKSSWEKMVGVAMQLRGRVSNPAKIELLNEANELLRNYVPPSDRNFFIQPEGMAAVKAFLESPRGPEEKTYAIVDVGAGTTEVSFFFNGGIRSKGGIPQPSYLADSTESVGGGTFHAANVQPRERLALPLVAGSPENRDVESNTYRWLPRSAGRGTAFKSRRVARDSEANHPLSESWKVIPFWSTAI
jgi:hypothetical protein